MIPATSEDRKKEAFRLFEDGRYHESLQLCMELLKESKDPAVEILAATNLYAAGRADEAEVFFRDLAMKMPDSSYVHSYLGKVLEARKDEGAIAEYALAVHLDPNNQDALRSYAEYLLTHQDFRGALPVLRRLVQLAKKQSDIKNLMRTFIEIGEAGEALATYAELAGDHETMHEYIDALAKTHDYRKAAESALRWYRKTEDPVLLRKYLDALSHYDVPAALEAYASHTLARADNGILFDYALLLQSTGNLPRAQGMIRQLLTGSRDPVYRLAECDLLSTMGHNNEAIAACEALIREELAAKNDLAMLGRIISRYRTFLISCLNADEVCRRFLTLVASDVNVVSLLETARLYEQLGNTAEARAWYYRAYRADFLTGGLAYARFLSSSGEERECEKVMLYILANVRKSTDLSHVAAVIVSETEGMFRLKRLMGHLIQRLEERRTTLSSEGLEQLAIAFFTAGSYALEEMDYAGCKYYCLCGMDVLPVYTQAIHHEDFLQLIRACKERSIADRPIMNMPHAGKHPAAPPGVQAQEISDQLGLSEQEQKILGFLRSHRKASEMELRKLLGTRRVVGVVNRLIQKAAAEGMHLIEKKGVGEDGEVYEYTGT
jgi:tetratricopeptide (TPR) repeat protein